MGYSPKKLRTPWEDKFKRPSLEDLREGMNKERSTLLDAARDAFLSLPGVQEEVSWQGLPWRWTLTYRCPDDPKRIWAYLVPDPANPKLSMPLTSAMVSALPMHRFKKHVKDAVLNGRMVDGVYWATWEITTKPQLSDILELANQRRKHAAKN